MNPGESRGNSIQEAVSPLIVKTPDIIGGKARIAGHRISVKDVVVWYEEQGMSVAEIIREYPELTKKDIYAALLYYEENKEEIVADITRAKQYPEDASPSAREGELLDSLENAGISFGTFPEEQAILVEEGLSENISKLLRCERELAGLSISDLAERANMDETLLSAMESASFRGHSSQILARIMFVLGKTLSIQVKDRE